MLIWNLPRNSKGSNYFSFGNILSRNNKNFNYFIFGNGKSFSYFFFGYSNNEKNCPGLGRLDDRNKNFRPKCTKKYFKYTKLE